MTDELRGYIPHGMPKPPKGDGNVQYLREYIRNKERDREHGGGKGGGNGASGGPLEEPEWYLENGIPEGAAQWEVFVRMITSLCAKEWSRDEVYEWWRAVADKSTTRPDDPWTDAHFNRFWSNARVQARKLRSEREHQEAEAERELREVGFLKRPRNKAAKSKSKPKQEIFPPPSDPMAVARKLVSSCWRYPGGQDTLHRWRGNWMYWDTTRWREAEELAIKKQVYTRLEHAVYKTKDADGPWLPNRNKVTNVIEATQAITYLQPEVSPPVWLTDEELSAREIVSCSNGLLDVTTKNLYSHTPDFFNIVSVPFPYDPDAPEPGLWLGFLRDLWPEDPEPIDALQEWFGYVISGRTDLQKILLMVGPPRSGKGTIARVLTALIGALNVAAPTLSSLETNFGLQPLLGKTLAVVSDARLNPSSDKKVVERLLSVSGEDSITVDRKYREAWTGPIPVRFMIISNELPRFGDSSGAIANRFIILELTRDWLDNEDTKLTQKLLEELPGIMSWALEGLDRVVQNSYLLEPKSSNWARNILKDVSSPMQAFIRDKCVRDPEGRIRASHLYEIWKVWCYENGIDHVTDKLTFGRDLHAAIPGLKMVSKRMEGGRVKHYAGLKLR